MGHHNTMSESIEMYLLRIALLQQESQPVPVPKLAQELAVSPVSANEMCRKLTEKELLTYEPYKGVQLTASGEAMARRVIRHRRLWEVFFVDRLGLQPAEAEEIACRFEHVTPDSLADRLDEFLEHPSYSPQHEPIPAGHGEAPAPATLPLTSLAAGGQATIAQLNIDAAAAGFLQQQGLQPGARVQVVAASNSGALLLAVGGRRLSVVGEIAANIEVIIHPEAESNCQQSPFLTEAVHANG